jgi:rod shape-determining protein MreC
VNGGITGESLVMSAKPVQQKAPWILAALLLSQVILMSTNARRGQGDETLLRVWVMTLVTPVAEGANKITSSVSDVVASYTDLRHAREENVELKERNQQLTEELNAVRERVAELEQLRAERALPPLVQFRQIAGNVIARDTSLWFRRLVIDRGSIDGVKRDMPVVATGGVVGRVIAVGPNFSMIQVITDKHAGLGAMLQGSRAMGELRGEVSGTDSNYLELRNISSTENVQPGESVVTTGLDRIYPKGLLVGTVERVEENPNAPWHTIIIKPAAQVDRVEHVLVLLVEPKDLKIDEPGK